MSGFKTRNEWFRASVRKYLDDIERKKALQKLKKIEVEGLEEKSIEQSIDGVPKRQMIIIDTNVLLAFHR